MKTSKSALRLALLPLFLSVSPAALAIDWQGGDAADPTNWIVDNNWDGGTAPVKDDDVFIDTGVASPAVVDTLSTPVITVLTVGNTPTGVGSSLTIENGGAVTNRDAYIGRGSGSVGTVNVRGGSTWTNSILLYVGYQGKGTLNIEDSSTVNSFRGYIGEKSGSEGTVNVTGGSTWNISVNLSVGFDGTGTLNIENGSTVATENGDIGNRLGSEGTVNVIGTGSKWNVSGNLHVGIAGKGTLNIENGGLVESNDVEIGDNSNLVEGFLVLGVGIATVKGENSKWGIDDNLIVGRGGNGTLNIENKGVVESMTGIIGRSSGSIGTVKVTGAGSKWDVDDSLTIGRNGTGTLHIQDGGAVTNNGIAYIGRESDSEGTVNVRGAGSTWESTGELNVGYGGTGTLTLSDDGLAEFGDEGAGSVNLATGGNSTGTINMGAASGETAMAPGELDAALVEFGEGTATLVFNHTDNTGTYAFTPVLESDSVLGTHLILHEAGYTNFNGDGSLFDGTTTINGGQLAINNVLSGTVEVNNGGTLGGIGTLGGAFPGATNINEGGTVAPGNSIGTLTVNNITFGEGSIYAVELDETPNTDLLQVTGTAILAGGTVTVSGVPLVTHTYTILTSTNNALTDEFAGVTDTAFYDYTLIYDANNVYLTGQPTNSFCDVASAANQKSLACDGLESLPPDDEIPSTIYQLPTVEEAREAYDALAGEFHPSLKSVLMENGQRGVDAVKNRLREGFAPDAPQTTTALGYFAAPTAFDAPALPTDGDNGAWISGYGSWSTIDATTTTVKMENDLGGVVFGLDREAFDSMRFGILGGYSQTETTQSDRASTGSAETMSVGFYGGAELHGATLSFGGIYNWHEIDTDRTVSYTGLSQDLTASYTAESWQLFAEAGYKIQLHDKAMVEPFAAISHMSIDTEAYSETGGSAALTASADTQSTSFTTLGARAAIEISNAVRATGMAGWRYAFGDVDPSANFTLSGSNPFAVAGAPIAENAFVGELGVEADLPIGGIISASYVGQMGDGTSAHGVDVSFKMKF